MTRTKLSVPMKILGEAHLESGFNKNFLIKQTNR